MLEAIKVLWAKTAGEGMIGWHPIILHMVDVAAVAEAILEREPASTRNRMTSILGMDWGLSRPWLLLVIACHDLGKACPGFQCKWPILLPDSGLQLPRSPNKEINHAFVSQIALAEFLQNMEWPDELADLVADAVGCHHGERASPLQIDRLSGDRRALGGEDWSQVRQALMTRMYELFIPGAAPTKMELSGPDFMLLAGLTSFADWIGSNEEWFPFGKPEDCDDLQTWLGIRHVHAQKALDTIGWLKRDPLLRESKAFSDIFGLQPRPLQIEVAEALADFNEPGVLLVEAPMGEGKTEAAFFAHLELQRRFGHRGLYIALPTRATGNAMFQRTLEFMTRQGSGRTLDFQLLHGTTLLNDTFQNLRIAGVCDPFTGADVRAGEWFTQKKRALLSEYGVGTVDQALLPILPVRHNFVRFWGLANRVVIFDEIHAYDAYTGTLLVHLLRWLLAFGSSVVLLSATLPPSARRRIADTVAAEMPAREVPYPRLSLFQRNSVTQTHFKADPTRKLNVRTQGVSPDLQNLRSAVEAQLPSTGMALILTNTVQRAQDLFNLFPGGNPLEHNGWRVGKKLCDGTEIFMFHARFPADSRQQRENNVLNIFGAGKDRVGRKILIATQVVEQSLDLDFDLMATDLAPVDLVLQRAGRLWRHPRAARPISKPTLLVAGLSDDEPPPFGKPLWWGAVYREDVLLRTWALLRNCERITLPDDIDDLVQAVYEEQVCMPESLKKRLSTAMTASEGEAYAFIGQANQAIIGLPDDASWNQPERFVLYDEDDPHVRGPLMAQTRLGTDSVLAIPIWEIDSFDPGERPDFRVAKQFFLRVVNLSRQRIVRQLKEHGVPEGWKMSPLLRNCFPLQLSRDGRWLEDKTVRLDEDLGLVYETEEDE